jgi:hypothetical protein
MALSPAATSDHDDMTRIGDRILQRVAPLLRAAGVDPHAVSCVIDEQGPRLYVTFAGPAVPLRIVEALPVRVLEALRGLRRTLGDVDVAYVSSDVA